METQTTTETVQSTSTETHGRTKGDISFSSARKLIDAGKFSYEEICQTMDAGNGTALSKAVKDLAKPKSTSSDQKNQGGRKMSPETLTALSELGFDETKLQSLDEKTKRTVIRSVRDLVKSREVLKQLQQ